MDMWFSEGLAGARLRFPALHVLASHVLFPQVGVAGTDDDGRPGHITLLLIFLPLFDG
jgi:hypothetical protein